MWTRSDLKGRGKIAFKANYWMCVLVSLILAIISVAQSSGTRSDSDSEGIVDAIKGGADVTGLSIGTFAAIVGGVAVVAVLISIAVTIFVKNVLIVGCDYFFVNNATQKANIGDIAVGFRKKYMNVVVGMLLMGLFTALWTLLFIIPGIIKAYEYRMIPYLLAENPDMNWKEAFEKSKEMMNGNKMNAFVLDLSFLGWHILGAITCGIVEVLWTLPYVNATNAELYLTLKNGN